jgi:hypothetical protein
MGWKKEVTKNTKYTTDVGPFRITVWRQAHDKSWHYRVTGTELIPLPPGKKVSYGPGRTFYEGSGLRFAFQAKRAAIRYANTIQSCKKDLAASAKAMVG